MCEIVEEYAKNYAKEYAVEYAKEQFHMIARNLLKSGMSSDSIHLAIPDLSIHEIQKLQQNLNC